MATSAKATTKGTPAKKAGTAVATVPSKTSALVSIQAEMQAALATLADRTQAPSGDKIQIKNDKTFHLPDGTVADELQVIIVDFTAYNAFYEGAYNKDAVVPPTCFAINPILVRMAPSENSPVKQSDSCGTCPMNQFNTASNGGGGKACKNMRRLCVLPVDADEDAPLWILDTSPTACKSFDGYVRSIATKFNVLPVGVVTTVSFDPNLDYPTMRFGDPTPNENMAEHWTRRGEAQERLEQEPDVSSYAAAPAPTTKARKPAPAAKVRR